MIFAADQLRSQRLPVSLLFVVGEEVTHDGAEAANDVPTTSRILINGEPTENTLAIGSKGAMRFTLRTTGVAAHSAYPHLGESAIEPMVDLLAALRRVTFPGDPALGATTVNVGVLRGGTEANIVPDHAEAELMVRLVGDVADVKRMLEAWVDGRAEVEYGTYIPAQHFHTVPGFDTMPVAYTSDIPLLDRWGAPLLYGPGSIHVAHTAGEHIDVDELRGAVDAYERLVRTLLDER
jgi:acetylornithine deacetylase